MRIEPTLLAGLAAASFACGGGTGGDTPPVGATTQAQPQAAAAPTLALEPIEDEALAKFFAKGVTVFGVPIVATVATPDDKVVHAAHVMAQYLDNDEDGTPDNPLLVETMRSKNALLVMFADFDELRQSGLRGSELRQRYEIQDLEGHETLPTEGFDAALEEVLHLITFAGYSAAYPEAFAETKGSKVADAMDLARGGHFEEIPAEYPEGAWYHYGDETCEYGCMVTEYFYWALTSHLGGQADPERCEEIAIEWKPCTPEKLKEMDPAIHALLTDPEFSMPTRLPDGSYRRE